MRRLQNGFDFSASQSFNPRTYVRCDKDEAIKYAEEKKFQSTHLCEVRHTTARATIDRLMGFNPRTCVRCDYRPTTKGGLHTSFNPRTCVRCDNDGCAGCL